MRENEHLKEKLAQIEASSQICFHGKNLPPPQGNLRRVVDNKPIRRFQFVYIVLFSITQMSIPSDVLVVFSNF